MVPASVLIGCLIWVGSVTCLELARAGRVAPAVFWVVLDWVFAILDLLALAAVVVVVRRARTAPAEETRRVALFGIGFLMFVGLAAANGVVEAFSPGDRLSNYQWSPTIGVRELLRFPGILLLWYSVLAVRVPHLREVVRASFGRLLARGWLFGGGAAATAAVLGWRLASRPEQTVGAVAADPVVQSLAAATAVLLVVAAARGRLLVRLDAWLYPETADQRQALADAAAALAKLGRITAISRTVRRTGQARLRHPRHSAGPERRRGGSAGPQRLGRRDAALGACVRHRLHAGDGRWAASRSSAGRSIGLQLAAA